jgi:hypothetical protein
MQRQEAFAGMGLLLLLPALLEFGSSLPGPEADYKQDSTCGEIITRFKPTV